MADLCDGANGDFNHQVAQQCFFPKNPAGQANYLCAGQLCPFGDTVAADEHAPTVAADDFVHPFGAKRAQKARPLLIGGGHDALPPVEKQNSASVSLRKRVFG